MATMKRNITNYKHTCLQDHIVTKATETKRGLPYMHFKLKPESPKLCLLLLSMAKPLEKKLPSFTLAFWWTYSHSSYSHKRIPRGLISQTITAQLLREQKEYFYCGGFKSSPNSLCVQTFPIDMTNFKKL